MSPVKPGSLAAAASALAATTRSGTQSPERERSLANRTTTTTATTTKGQLLSARKPRISRSRIIAKLGAQRAAATATATATSSSSRLSSSSRPTVATATGSKIPRASGGAVRASRVRSSMGTATRRSYAGAKSAGRGSDVLMSAKKHVRQSEFVRRRSRMTGGSAVGVVASGAAVDCGMDDGSMEMDVDED